MNDFEICPICDRGNSACLYCKDLDREDWETICDCGLYDFQAHIFDCLKLKEKEYVII